MATLTVKGEREREPSFPRSVGETFESANSAVANPACLSGAPTSLKETGRFSG